MQATRDARFEAMAVQIDHRFDGDIKTGGQCVSATGGSTSAAEPVGGAVAAGAAR